MSYQRRKCFLAVLCFLKMVLATTDGRNVSHGNENPVCDIGAVMDQSNRTRQSKATRGYTMLQITGEHLETEELCRMHQSLYVAKEPEEMISIITIKNNCQKSYTTEEYILEFTKAIQDYTNQNEDHYTHDSLGLTVEYVKQSYAQDLDQTNIEQGQYKDIEAMVEALVIAKQSKICFDVFKCEIINSLYQIFYDLVKHKWPHFNFDESEVPSLSIDWMYVIYELDEDLNDYTFYPATELNLQDNTTAFYDIYKCIKNTDEYANLRCKEENYLHLYRVYFGLITEEHVELFKRRFRFIGEMLLGELKEQELFTAFAEKLCLIAYDLQRHFEETEEFVEEDSERITEVIYDFCDHEKRLNVIHEFFTRIEFISAYMQYFESSTADTDAAHCKMQSERTTKLVVQGKITDDNIPHLCCALQDNDVFANLALDQYIYVKVYEIESESKSKTFITKRKDSTVSVKTGTMKIGYCTHVKVVGLDTEADESVSEVENLEKCEGCEEEVTETYEAPQKETKINYYE